MANVAAIRIEQTRYAEIEQARRLLARDLEQAAEIQRSFLPGVAPEVRGLETGRTQTRPAIRWAAITTIFSPMVPAVWAMVLGDVSGKGMPASLLMMGLQARVQVLFDGQLAEVMRLSLLITSPDSSVPRLAPARAPAAPS